jgi:putative transposase
MAALSWILVIVAWLRDKLRTGWQILLLAFLLRRHPVHYRQPKSCAEKKHYYHYSRKPEWVKRKIIYLKARYPYMGCRTLANLFNQIYTEKRKMTVGKTYISRVIQQHRYEIQVLRRRIKNRKPKPQPKNRTWGIDLTQVRDTNNQPHTLLGIIDHGTRACVALERIPDKTSFTLLRFICDMAER